MKLSLSDMKAKSTDYFFSPGAMKFFKGSKYYGYHRFDENTGKTEPVEREEVFGEWRKSKGKSPYKLDYGIPKVGIDWGNPVRKKKRK